MALDDGFNLEYSYLTLPDVFYERIAPTQVAAPQVVVFNNQLANEIGLDVSGLSDERLAAFFVGNALPKSVQPFAQAYAGHQFGHFTMLGDGRAHVLGELLTPAGSRLDLQLKGSGRTPYSRGGDGRAVLGPMLREYLISEAMHALGIPTTRALAVVATGEPVQRETLMPGAVLTRVATAHLRVGTFEFAAAHRDASLAEALLDYTIDRLEPELAEADNKALALLDAMVIRQADLIVHWMRVGFIHGVMNTDNMALSGETIDYGPCAFMDTYDPQTVFSSIDANGRYAYANQPAIGTWNLVKLAEALLPLIDTDIDQAVELAQASLNQFAQIYQNKWLAMMRSKLGLLGIEESDTKLITGLLDWIHSRQADYTNTFLDLAQEAKPTGEPYGCEPYGCEPYGCEPYGCEAFGVWYDNWQARLRQHDQSITAAHSLMQETNPAVIPRNHQVEAALAAAMTGDLKPFLALHAVLKSPYETSEAIKPYQAPPGPGACDYRTFCGT